jgi:uncharacterized protein (TIGR02679 family)
MGKDYSRQDSVTISMEEFQKALDKTRFSGLDLKDLLNAYAGGNLLTRAQEDEIYSQEKAEFFAELWKIHQGEKSRLVLSHIKNKGSNTRGIHQAYDKDSSILKVWLNNVLRAVEDLPEAYEKLPVFANRITKNPHEFDINSEKGRLLVLALQIIWAHQKKAHSIISSPTAEEITEILGNFNIIRDDILNFVTCAGLLGLNGGKIIPMWQEALKEGSVLNVPLREVARTASFIPAISLSSDVQNKGRISKEKAVFVVENSGVFSEIIDCYFNKGLPPLICTHGQFKLAALLLMDKLVNEGVVLYYSGDFDPEGLQMAERLITRYSQSLRLWRYTVDDYERCLSKVSLTQTRLKKLASITSSSLIDLKERMLLTRKAGYQEQLVPVLANDLDLKGMGVSIVDV